MSQVYIPHILLIIWGVISMIVMKQVGSKSSEVDNANNIWMMVKVDGNMKLHHSIKKNIFKAA